MKTLFLLLFLMPALSFGNSVMSVSDKALVELQAISDSWKKVKDPKTAVASVMFTKVTSAKLTALAKTLTSYKRPSNAERRAIKLNRQKAIDKIGLEMANTMMMLRRQPRSMAILTSGLAELEKEMTASQKIFDYYFEPTVEANKAPVAR